MSRKASARQIIYDWINVQLFLYRSFEFSSVEVQDDIVKFGRARNIYHTPDYYSREWRGIREMEYTGFSLPFNVEEFFKKGSKVKWYRVTRS